MYTRSNDAKWVSFHLLVFCFILLPNFASAKDVYPSSFNSFSGGGSFCVNSPATDLSATINTTSCGNGANVNIPITYSWYSNTTNSTVGGTLVSSSAGITALTNLYTPPTNLLGTLYYYCVVSWAAGACAPAGSFTSASTIAVTVTGAPCACNPTALNCGANDFINNVELNTMVNSSTCATGGYVLYSALTSSTSLRATLTYPLTISVGAGTGNHGAGVWFDWNRNGLLTDAGEFYLISNAIAPSTTFSINITVPAGASIGTTRMRIRYVYNVAVTAAMSCNTAGIYGETEDYDIEILPAPVNMVYSSTNVTQVTTNVNAGSFRQEVLRVNVVTNGQLSAPNATQMVFTTLGTTNIGDITNARLYYTGNSSIFSTSSPMGIAVAVPPLDPANMVFNFSQTLAEGDNNFWIAYDVVATAPGGNVIDAKLVSTTVAGNTYSLNATPAGSRPIVASTTMSYVSSVVVQNSNPLPAGSTLNDVIQVQVVTSGAINPLQVTSMTFRTNGTTNTGDIQNARVFYTGDSPTFNSATQFGATLVVPPAINTDFTMLGSVSLVQGTNYFWLVYDVKPTAACDPAQIDGLCNNIVIGGVSSVPLSPSPLGARVINCGTAYFSQCSCDMMNPANWNTARNGSGVALGSVADFAISTNSFYVQKGNSMTTSISDTISNLYLEPGSYVTASRLITINRLYIQSFATFEQTYSQTNATIGGSYIGSFYIKRDGTWKHNNVGWLPGSSTTQYFEPYSIQWFQGVGGRTFPGGTAWGSVILDIPNAPNLIINANSLSTIRGNLDIRRWGTSTNYFYINMDNPIDVDGNLIISGGVVKGISGFSCSPAGCTCNQAANGIVVNVDGDFIMSGGEWNDFSCGANSSSGMAMAVGGNVRISGGVIKMNNKITSKLDLVPTVPSTTWSQTGGTVTLGNTNLKSGKTVTLVGTKIGDVASSTALTVETGSKLMCSNFPITGSGNFVLQNGGHLGIGSAAGITASGASGNVQVSGSRTYNSAATYEYYEGLTPQSTGNFTTTVTNAQYPALVNRLIINKANPADLVNLTSTTDVSGNLDLVRGVLRTSFNAGTAPWIRIQSSAAVNPAGGSQISYVDGFIRRQGSTDFTFPTGNLGRWSRIGILAPTAGSLPVTTEFEARYVALPFSNTSTMAPAPVTVLDHVSKREHWVLNKTVVDGSSTKVRLYWEDAFFSVIYKFDSLTVGRYSGSAWENTNCYVNCPPTWTASTPQRTYAGSVNALGAAGYIQSNTTTQFGPFTLSSIGLLPFNPLPVELLTFNAECSPQGGTELSWTTATEENNDFYLLERSTDGVNFEPVGVVPGSGTTSQPSEYSYLDRTAAVGINYYRLSQTDFDGTTDKLKTISVRCDSKGGAVNIYNNNQGELVVQVEGSGYNRYQVRIFDSLGKLVLDQRFNAPNGFTTEKFNITDLQKGVYYVHVFDSVNGTTGKISIQ